MLKEIKFRGIGSKESTSASRKWNGIQEQEGKKHMEKQKVFQLASIGQMIL